jgi:hypothetical protein
MNLGKFRFKCQCCDTFAYTARRELVGTKVCRKCDKSFYQKRAKVDKQLKKKYDRILTEIPDYFESAEQFADDIASISADISAGCVSYKL